MERPDEKNLPKGGVGGMNVRNENGAVVLSLGTEHGTVEVMMNPQSARELALMVELNALRAEGRRLIQ